MVTIISDCSDINAVGRYSARVGSLFNQPIQTMGVSEYSEIQLAGNLIDIIDAYGEEPGIILANAAPRHGKGKRWKNGTPFGFFKYKNILIVSTIDGLTLSLVKKLGLVNSLKVTDIPQVMEFAVKSNLLNKTRAERITNTQFRSFDYQPFLAKWAWDGLKIPTTDLRIADIEDIDNCIWHIDNFGNIKTTLTNQDIAFSPGSIIKTNFGELKCYNRLKDVPDGELALIEGSSGINDNRFLEIVHQGRHADMTLNLTIGDNIRILSYGEVADTAPAVEDGEGYKRSSGST